MTPLALPFFLFAFLTALGFLAFLRSLRRRAGVLPSWRVTDYGIRCVECGEVLQSGREPFSRAVCTICKNHEYDV